MCHSQCTKCGAKLNKQQNQARAKIAKNSESVSEDYGNLADSESKQTRAK